MAIRGLTDRGAELPQVGTLRKGAPKPANGPGQDLKHFRFDTEDAEAAERFKQAYGAEPVAIRVFLPFSETDKNFEAWKEEWTASSLKHRCDGENCVRWLQQDGTYSDKPKPCPGGCKQVGRLKVIIPELKRWALVTALTTSIHDIIQLHANLTALESARGDLRGIPLILKRAPRKISTPRGKGDRVRAEKWLLTIEAQPQWVELQLAEQERQALPKAEALALPAWDGDGDEDLEEIEAEVARDDGRAEIQAELHDIWIAKGKTEGEWLKYAERELDPKSTRDLGEMLLKWRVLPAASAKAAKETVAV